MNKPPKRKYYGYNTKGKPTLFGDNTYCVLRTGNDWYCLYKDGHTRSIYTEEDRKDFASFVINGHWLPYKRNPFRKH